MTVENITEETFSEETLQKKRGAKRKSDDDGDLKARKNREIQRRYHSKKKELFNSLSIKIKELEETLKKSKEENNLLITENESLKEREEFLIQENKLFGEDNDSLTTENNFEISPTNTCNLNNKNNKIDHVIVGDEREEYITKLQTFFFEKLNAKYIKLYSEFMQEFLHLEEFQIIDENNFTYSDWIDDLNYKIKEGEYFITKFQMFFYDHLGVEYMNLFSEFIEEENERIKNELISFYLNDKNEISNLDIEKLERTYLILPSDDKIDSINI
ncbi:4389_t:CDS:2 [Scutellospora calospora]|uniref:4389_t:CDS:1 n=1 Tax=Scutellospora calospora TaxID=85575 RepID=A0ACA9MX36_9GLOM|nr:4389_t:CDS:2 [Scutellospora calospora]